MTQFYNGKLTILAVLCCCIIKSHQAAVGDDKIEEMKKISEECSKETGTDETLMLKAMVDNEYSEEENFKCYLKCFMQKKGDMDATGNINVDESEIEGPQKDKILELLHKCKETKADDMCDTAYNFTKCFTTEFRKLL